MAGRIGHAATLAPTSPWQLVWQRFFRRYPQDNTPLTIAHQRIYILPSRRGWVFIGSLLIMLIASMNYAINLGFALCFLLSGMLASSLLATYRNLAGLTLEKLDAGNAYVGEALLYRVTFCNPHARPRPGIKVTTATGEADIITLEPRSHTDAEIAVITRQRGWQALGRLTLSTDYPLGLWYSWSYVHIPCKGLVYPAPEPNAPPIPVGRVSDNGDAEQSPRHGEEEFYGLKPYQTGEPLSRIAWKAAARGQGWHSKAFVRERGRLKYRFSLEDARDIPGDEGKLSRLTTWVLAAHREGLDYAVALPGFQSAVRCGAHHRDAILEKLAIFGLDDDH
ncbi:MAG TPA: hypothetical protein DD979_02935 [Gammaproteobacteria bacterium]|nr:hypothetical protein [Gammaproteobacteria bacterium]